MKVFGIILLVFSVLNFIVALVASANGVSNAAGQKFSAAILLVIVGCIFYYIGNKRNLKKDDLESDKSNDNRSFTVKGKDHNRTEQRQEQVQNKREVEHQKNSKKLKITKEDEDDYPRPLTENLTPSDMALLQSKYMDECLSIMADGGTKDQTKIKFELLLGKRKKTTDMIRIEEQVRSLYREIYDQALVKFRNVDTDNLLTKLAATTKIMEIYNDFNNEDGEGYKTKQLFIDIANKYGISVNLIEQEEHTRALSRFDNSKKPSSL